DQRRDPRPRSDHHRRTRPQRPHSRSAPHRRCRAAPGAVTSTIASESHCLEIPMAWTVPVLWTNDDVQYGYAEQHRRQLQFLDDLGIPGVFYVVPKNGENTLDTDTELLRLIESSRNR